MHVRERLSLAAGHVFEVMYQGELTTLKALSPSCSLMQVKAELAAADGRVAAATSRPCTITYRSPLVRGIRCAPASCTLPEHMLV